MAKNNSLVVILPVLLLVAVLVWFPSINPSASKSKKAKDRAGSKLSQVDEMSALIREISLAEGPKGAPGQWGGRNPFVRRSSITKTPQLLESAPEVNYSEMYRVNGIFWNETKPSVIINDEVYSVGSKLGVLVVREIRPDEVVLVNGDKEIVLKLKLDWSSLMGSQKK